MSSDGATGFRFSGAVEPGAMQVGQPWPSTYFSIPAMPLLSELVKPSTCAPSGPLG